jgi:integrase
MPRRSSGPRLWLDKNRQTWTIIDGRKTIRTGCGAEDIQSAKDALKEYLATHHKVKKGGNPILSDVLALYAKEVVSKAVAAQSISYDLEKLESWWGEKTASEVTSDNCDAYVEHRDAPTICRRELGFLAAALNHWHKSKNGPLNALPVIKKPPRSQPRNHFLEREEAAKMLWAGRRKKRFVRFFLIGWYTGTRHNAILQTRWDMIDFKTGVMLRRPPGKRETKKRTPPVKIGPRLLAHLRRWKRLDGPKATHIMTYGGVPVRDINYMWNTIRDKAGMPANVTPHILRHSRATHLMRQGVDPWQGAQSLGMSVQVLVSVYGHHRPDWQQDAAKAK